MIWTTTPWTLPANRAISIAPDFDYALVQIDGQAVILAKDLVESVMQRIGVTDYTILGTVKGAELELLRFTHPFMGFDVPAILGDHVTLRCRYRCRSHRAWPRPGRLCDRSEIRPGNR